MLESSQQGKCVEFIAKFEVLIRQSTVCRLAFIMQQTFSLQLMQCQTTSTTTDNTSTHYNATVSAATIYLQ